MKKRDSIYRKLAGGHAHRQDSMERNNITKGKKKQRRQKKEERIREERKGRIKEKREPWEWENEGIAFILLSHFWQKWQMVLSGWFIFFPWDPSLLFASPFIYLSLFSFYTLLSPFDLMCSLWKANRPQIFIFYYFIFIFLIFTHSLLSFWLFSFIFLYFFSFLLFFHVLFFLFLFCLFIFFSFLLFFIIIFYMFSFFPFFSLMFFLFSFFFLLNPDRIKVGMKWNVYI